jgi:hypothetical protein
VDPKILNNQLFKYTAFMIILKKYKVDKNVNIEPNEDTEFQKS